MRLGQGRIFGNAVLLAGVLLAGFGVGFAFRWSLSPSLRELQARMTASLVRGDSAGAELALREVLARYPNSSEANKARLLLADWAKKREDWKMVAAVLSEVPDSVAGAGAIRVQEGDAWVKLNRFRQATTCFERAARLDPNGITPRHRLIFVHGMQMNREPWFAALWGLADAGQANLRDYLQILIARNVVWNATGSVELMNSVLEQDPADLGAWRALAVYLGKAGNPENGLAVLEELHRRDRDDALTLQMLADAYAGNARWDELEKLLGETPGKDSDGLIKARGALLLARGKSAEAKELLERLARKNPYDAELLNRLAQAARQTGAEALARQSAHLARRLAEIEMLALTLNTNGWNVNLGRQIVASCVEIGLNEEALGVLEWARNQTGGAELWTEWDSKRASLQKTSTRKPPAWESFAWAAGSF